MSALIGWWAQTSRLSITTYKQDKNNAPYFSQAMVKTENFAQANALIPELQKVLG
ncbi:hypothetical protein OH492_20040 [Vibrio chagasii]|nr:hypothetical protein [Vibrio chagasii]